jgi:hypothetical protein
MGTSYHPSSSRSNCSFPSCRMNPIPLLHAKSRLIIHPTSDLIQRQILSNGLRTTAVRSYSALYIILRLDYNPNKAPLSQLSPDPRVNNWFHCAKQGWRRTPHLSATILAPKLAVILINPFRILNPLRLTDPSDALSSCLFLLPAF